LLAFGFTNSVPAIAPVGGSKSVIGTNPMSFAVPATRGKIAFLIDQSSSAVAWTSVRTAAEQGRTIPFGWALDKNGQPTDDPMAGLAGSMAPAGGYKGFGQGLIVEVMCAAMTGSFRGLQMGSMVDDDGKAVGNGQFFIALSPRMFSGNFDRQVKALIKSITVQPGARMPNSQREANAKRLKKSGLAIDAELLKTIQGYCK
jgi:(2R)-3-sulfolactate dehydrogenase (NADP+)